MVGNPSSRGDLPAPVGTSRHPPAWSHSASSRAAAVRGPQILRAVEKAVSQGRKATPEATLLSPKPCTPPKIMHIPPKNKQCALQKPAVLDLAPEHGEAAARVWLSCALRHRCHRREGFGGHVEGEGSSPKAWVHRDVLLPQMWLFGASSSLPHARLPDLPLLGGVSLMSSYSALAREQWMSQRQWVGEPEAPLGLPCWARRLSFQPRFAFRGDAQCSTYGLFFCFTFI